MNRKWLIVIFAVGGVLVLASLITFFVLQAQGEIALRPAPTPTLPPIPTLDITLPPSLAELAEDYPELADILTDPELDSVYKEFLVAYEEGGEEAALELARERSLLTPDNSAIRVTLVLDTVDHDSLIEELETIGVTVVSAYEDRVNISVPVALVELQMESDEPLLIFEQLGELDHVIAVRLPEERGPNSSNIPGEGVALTNAETWHGAGFTGSGVRIGVLDMGFAGRESLAGTELPQGVPIETFGWIDESEIHGTACAEIVHEMAPDAELIFAWYDGTDAAMGEAVEWLLNQGVNIISNSTGGVYGPRDGTGWDSQLVDSVAAQGVLWVNSSGNEALAHYRATFTDNDGDGLHEFAPDEEMLGIYVGRGGYVSVILQWEDSWGSASQDYDLYLYDAAGNVLGASEDYQNGQAGQEPVEYLGGEVDEDIVYAVVAAVGANQAVPIDIFVRNADLFINTPEYSVNTPGDAIGSLTVGAANFWDDSLAEYSSQGPTVDGRLKPEISAPTGVSGASYGTQAFDGTSSSCPHVAGAAALVWQANPSFSREDVMNYMLNNARDLGPSGPDTGFGYGRLQLPAPPGSSAQPMPTVTPISGEVDPQPIVTPTPVSFVEPEPQPQPGPGNLDDQLLALGFIGFLMSGMCCLGTGLVFFGLIGLIVGRRRKKRQAQRRRPPQQPTPRRAQRRPPPRRPPQRRAPPPQAQPGPPQQPRQGQPPAATTCPHCQAPIRAGARFCPKCGKPV